MITLADYGVTFDEPIYMEAAWNVKEWLSLKPHEMFGQKEIDYYWKTDPERNIHPSTLKWLLVAAQKIIFWESDSYRKSRVLNLLIFSMALLLFLNWWAADSFWRSGIFLLLLLSIPRFFAHIHFSATDIPMTSFLMLFIVLLDKTLFRRSFWSVGIVLGLFVGIKLTSALLSLPIFLVYLLYYRDQWKTLIARIGIICLIGFLVFYAINPDWWFSPLSTCQEYLTQSLTRRSWTPFTVYFGGHLYNYRGPFYYPFTMFFITTPLLNITLLLSGIGYFFYEKGLRKNFKMILIFTCFAFPFLLLALPTSPAHDGIRYLVPSYPFAACFMTLGLQKLWEFAAERSSESRKKLATKGLVVIGTMALLVSDLNSPARVPPFELSYYNGIVGGLSGAQRKGYETTYWWEILNDDVIKRLNGLCGRYGVYFPATPTDLFFKHMRSDQKITFHPVQDPEKSKFMLIFGRPTVRFWESKTWPLYRREGKIPIPIWDISLDSVPLLRLYLIRDLNGLRPRA